jgi:branched-chain amino acid transport system substrate-binding protein
VSSPRYLVLRQLAVPALLLAALCVLAYFDTEIVSHFGSHLPDRAVIWLGDLLGVALWVAVAIFITRLVRVIVWDTVVAHAIGAPVPHLLKDVGAFIIFAIAACGMVHYVFDKSLTGFLATGGVIGLVLGMALQSVILDAFTGIVLNIERPYSIGDWIGLQNGEKETVFGKVTEVNWRAGAGAARALQRRAGGRPSGGAAGRPAAGSVHSRDQLERGRVLNRVLAVGPLRLDCAGLASARRRAAPPRRRRPAAGASQTGPVQRDPGGADVRCRGGGRPRRAV